MLTIARAFLLISFFPLLASAVDASDCPEKRYTGDMNEFVDLTIGGMSVARAGYDVDVFVSVFPKQSMQGLSFYGGAINLGDPAEHHSQMVYTTEEGRRVTWFLGHSKNFGKTSLLFWYHSNDCHVTAVLRLSDHDKVKAWLRR
jgi:hypothetical protein